MPLGRPVFFDYFCNMTQTADCDKTLRMDVAIATWQPEGIRHVEAMNLPKVPGVRYVVSWQLPGPHRVIPDSLACRDDISICFTDNPGLGANRVNACANCDADIILIADDDLIYTPSQLQAVIDTFDRNPDVDLATFQFIGSPKKYPEKECDLTLPFPKGYYVTTFEMACRLQVIRKVNFDSRFGLGAPLLQSGEDTKFLYDAIKAGFHCRFFPITICTHDHPSTGDKPMSKGVAMAEGKLIRLQYPGSWIFRIPLKAWRNKKKGGSFFPALYNLFRGALIKI